MFFSNFVILDLEYANTTPIPTIIEIGLLRVSTEGQIQGQYESLVQPKVLECVTDFIYDLTKITREELLIAPNFTSVWKESLDFIRGDVLVSWTTVDYWILKNSVEVAGFFWPVRVKYYDMMSILVERYWQQSGKVLSRKLSNACEQIGVTQNKQHRALEDCRTVLKLMTYIDKKPVKNEEIEKFELFEI